MIYIIQPQISLRKRRFNYLATKRVTGICIETLKWERNSTKILMLRNVSEAINFFNYSSYTN